MRVYQGKRGRDAGIFRKWGDLSYHLLISRGNRQTRQTRSGCWGFWCTWSVSIVSKTSDKLGLRTEERFCLLVYFLMPVWCSEKPVSHWKTLKVACWERGSQEVRSHTSDVAMEWQCSEKAGNLKVLPRYWRRCQAVRTTSRLSVVSAQPSPSSSPGSVMICFSPQSTSGSKWRG